MCQKPQAPNYDTIYNKLKNKANIAFIGTYYQSNGPCQIYSEGKKRRPLIKGFIIKKDFIGNIEAKKIEVVFSKDFKFDYEQKTGVKNLIIGENYFILLHVNELKVYSKTLVLTNENTINIVEAEL